MNTVYTEHKFGFSLISSVVILLFLCAFFLLPFVSAGTRYQFYYPGNRSLTGTPVPINSPSVDT